MNIRTKLAMFGVIMIGFSGAINAAMTSYFSGGPTTLNSSWYISIPTGASVRSLATATVGSVSNPAWYYGTSFPALPPNIVSYIIVNGVVIDSYAWGAVPSFSYTGSSPSNPSPSYATAVVGIAGPPAGLLHEARATIYGTGNYTYDEKWSYNLVGGEYGIWHGGGVSGMGAVTGLTEISW